MRGLRRSPPRTWRRRGRGRQVRGNARWMTSLGSVTSSQRRACYVALSEPLRECEISAAESPDEHNPGMTTVLVVDDEPVVREVVVKYLEREGFRTLEAGDGD